MATGKCHCPDSLWTPGLLAICIVLALCLVARSTSEPPIISPPVFHTVYHCEKYQNIEVQK
ncbi:putative movement protein 2 [Bermuda grass latent virus]|uniref:putative movement protein 2 n=1 Tax=Bermuda grass latent virus TaxID=1930269 RepID=UPI0009484FFF|nr:putative movement protein 2 [Bermuda grass latent virus]APQ46239.1 putative movement protein 2 [Bermuda grass latent virus]